MNRPRRRRLILALLPLFIAEGLLVSFVMGAVFARGPWSELSRLTEKHCRMEVVASASTSDDSRLVTRTCDKQLGVSLAYLILLIPGAVQIGRTLVRYRRGDDVASPSFLD